MEQIKIIFLLFSVVCIENTRGFNWTSTNPIFNSTCVDGSIIMAWDYTTDLGETVVLKEWKKLNGTGVIGVGDYDGSLLTAATGYENRLNLIGNAGLEINRTTLADAGTYYVLISTSSRTYTATATISVYVSPNNSCSPIDESIGKNLTCSIPYACPVKHDTKASWNINGQSYDYQYTCTYDDSGKTYKCCAEGNSTSTCSRDKLCIEHTCSSNKNCERELGCGIGLGLGIPCVITCIIVEIFICKGYTYAYQLGLLLGLGFGITFQVSWIIIVSLISTGNQCKLELGLALGLSSGIPCVIAFIIAVIFIFVEFKGFPSRVIIGKGIITGLLIASVIGIIVVYFLYEKLKADSTDEEPEEKPTEPNNKEPEEMPLGSTDKKNKTKHTGSSSAVSREHVEIQVEKKGVKGDEEKRPPAIHIRTQNRVESEPTNKKTSDKHQPLPPVGVVTEDRSKHRPQPPPPENSDVKDPNKRGISANFDDKQGLPTEPPRSSRLPPLTPKQPTVEEEDASKEKPKKKRKNRKKKGQMNEETQAEEMEELQNKTTEDQIDGD